MKRIFLVACLMTAFSLSALFAQTSTPQASSTQRTEGAALRATQPAKLASTPQTENTMTETLQTSTYELATKFGPITIELDEKAAPKTVANFKKLANEKYYDGTTFHRVIPGFMIQGGDPTSRDPAQRARHGTGGPGYTIPAEIGLKHLRGSLATARLGDEANPKKESSGSQFFICVKDCPFLDGEYTVFGRVVKGMDVVDKIVSEKRDPRDNPLSPVEMKVQAVFKK